MCSSDLGEHPGGGEQVHGRVAHLAPAPLVRRQDGRPQPRHPAGAGAGAARADGDRRLLEGLEPLFATALHAVGPARLQELDRLGYGHGLAFKWSVLEVP